LHTHFRRGQSGNPGGRSKKKLHALLADALNEQVFVTIDGECRKITKREAVVHQLVNKSATADLRATKMLFDMIKDVEQKASVTSPVPEPPSVPGRAVYGLTAKLASSFEWAGGKSGRC
jgi:hypothetical protein